MYFGAVHESCANYMTGSPVSALYFSHMRSPDHALSLDAASLSLLLDVILLLSTPVPGTAGLCNLGNTCYLNSSLQCLSNFAPLTTFFLSKEYETDLNKDNPLGHNGVLALRYSDLLQKMWSGQYRSINPTVFRKTAGECCDQFAGYAQQDSQELLSFLLDGLHEDLNRVLKKPFTEQDDSPDRPDHIAAQEVRRVVWGM
jgi:ubiquitin C-terminal hydrolase